MIFRCPDCRTRRRDHGLFTQHLRESGHRLCQCGHVAYTGTAFPHRRGTRYCMHHPLAGLDMAARYGATDDELEEIAIDIAFTTPGRVMRPAEAIPF